MLECSAKRGEGTQKISACVKETGVGRLSGKTALILGVAPGNLGEHIAQRFADEGARLMLAGRREGPLSEVAARVGALAQVCDIEQEKDIRGLVAAAQAQLGRIDVAVNATGWGLLKPFT
ncbi:MAG: SDR family oxidoreductase, partial [Sphingomonadales bacterium]|nr:SDR family oxidoreductase [Sphingomonadales bacterium]